MDKDLSKKMATLDPLFKKRVEELFKIINESVSDLYDAATHDEKTGLYNNKFFENILDMEMEKARRKEEKLCLFLIDIDFFKKINDTYGHVKADELLKKLARVIKKQIRKSDIAARFGGEEFFIILPETSLKKAKKLADRLKKSVKSDKTLKKYGINISGGLTEFKKGDTKRSFKQRADKALYKAKKSGRDRIIAVK